MARRRLTDGAFYCPNCRVHVSVWPCIACRDREAMAAGVTLPDEIDEPPDFVQWAIQRAEERVTPEEVEANVDAERTENAALCGQVFPVPANEEAETPEAEKKRRAAILPVKPCYAAIWRLNHAKLGKCRPEPPERP